jgi:hypothetical protein
MTTSAAYAEGLRVLWLLFSRGVSAVWDGTAVVISPPDSTADGAIEELEAVLRPNADGRSYLQRARERHTRFLQEVEAAKPADATGREWRRGIEGLESFLFSGWADEALRLGWSKAELYAIPPLWARVDLCGAGLAIGDRTITEITADAISILTPSGSTLRICRRPAVDYAVAYHARLKMVGEDAGRAEFQLRALEATANLYLANNPGTSIDEAKIAVLAATNGGPL